MLSPSPVGPGRPAVAILLSLSGCLAIIGCASPPRSGVDEHVAAIARASRDKANAKGATPTAAEWRGSPPLLSTTGNEQKEITAEQRVVVYTAGFRIVVQSIDDALKSMEQIASEAGGYVQKIESNTVTIRVPAAKYSAALERVAGLGQVADRQVRAEDVTEEFVDLEARLNNARNVRKRLEALLEKAEDVKAALAVETEIGRVSEEIERLQARLELLKHRVAYSTISAQFERVARQTNTIQGYGELPFYWLQQLDPNRLWNGY